MTPLQEAAKAARDVLPVPVCTRCTPETVAACECCGGSGVNVTSAGVGFAALCHLAAQGRGPVVTRWQAGTLYGANSAEVSHLGDAESIATALLRLCVTP